MNYRVRFVSFARLDDDMASSTLMPGQTAQTWQIKLLEDYIEQLKKGEDDEESEFI
jgi:hypothetical protein